MTNYYSKSAIIELLQAKAGELKRNPLPSDFDAKTAKGILTFFKKWDRALKAAGLLKKTVSVTAKVVVAKKAVQSVEKKIEKVEEKAEVKKPAAKKETDSGCNKRYTKEMIAGLLLAEYKRLGKKPTKKEIDANEALPSASTCLKHFNTTRLGDMWDEILG